MGDVQRTANFFWHTSWQDFKVAGLHLMDRLTGKRHTDGQAKDSWTDRLMDGFARTQEATFLNLLPLEIVDGF
jgi:hypothetical protein